MGFFSKKKKEQPKERINVIDSSGLCLICKKQVDTNDVNNLMIMNHGDVEEKNGIINEKSGHTHLQCSIGVLFRQWLAREKLELVKLPEQRLDLSGYTPEQRGITNRFVGEKHTPGTLGALARDAKLPGW